MFHFLKRLSNFLKKSQALQFLVNITQTGTNCAFTGTIFSGRIINIDSEYLQKAKGNMTVKGKHMNSVHCGLSPCQLVLYDGGSVQLSEMV